MKEEKISLEEKLFELQRGMDYNGANINLKASTINVPRSVCGRTVEGSSFQGNENGRVLTVRKHSSENFTQNNGLGQDDVSLQNLREVNQLELLAEQHLRAQGVSAGCSVSAADDYSGTGNAGGLSGLNRSMLKGKKIRA